MIPFNKPYLTGKETHYIYQAVYSGKISGNGLFTEKCHTFFQEKYNFEHCLLTTSCTDALEMSAILLNIEAGDEVIMPSYTFVSTANAFVLRGANIVFIDSLSTHPCIDVNKVEEKITEKTKAIVIVHYAGIACDMEKIMQLATQYNLYVVEDAAQAIDSFYQEKPLGSIGHLATFSFHETKNISAGEGGMLIINDKKLINRAEIIWEKGTNRKAFFKGETTKYNWMDIGSSFLPSEINAAFLYAQLEDLSTIQAKRIQLWNLYFDSLQEIKEKVQLPFIPNHATNNGHLFYFSCKTAKERTKLLAFLLKSEILAVFHYLPLHKSPYYLKNHLYEYLANCEHYEECLLRLPLFFELTEADVRYICETIVKFYEEYET